MTIVAPAVFSAPTPVAGRNSDNVYSKRYEALILVLTQHLSTADRATLLAIAHFESRFNPRAKNPHSSAYGIFQIIDATWLGLGFSKLQRRDPVLQILGGMLLLKRNREVLEQRGDGALNSAHRLIELYTLHHDGLSGRDLGGRTLAKKYVLPLYEQYEKMLLSAKVPRADLASQPTAIPARAVVP